MNFLCVVSGRFPENYEIGLRSGVWGVEERYEKLIRKTSVGDLLVFAVGGEIRSIHRLTGDVYREDSLLWPEKDGSIFPFRVAISEPLHYGRVSLKELAPRISFMRQAKAWGGTIQGQNGVFNNRLTDQDMELIQSLLRPYRAPRMPARIEPAVPVSLVSLSFFEDQLQAALEALLEQLGLVRTPADDRLNAITRDRDSSAFTLVARDRMTDKPVVVAMDTKKVGQSLILQVLRQMSAVRQKLPAIKELGGIILTDHVREDLRLVVNEIPNLSVRGYRMRFDLDPEPEKGSNGWKVA